MAMSCQTDRLSSLPDELLVTLLSFLPTEVAARTSGLSRRFRHLWKAIPSLRLICRRNQEDKFIAMADNALLRRHPSHPLLSLCLKFCYSRNASLLDSYIASLLAKALSLGLRHLAVKGYLDLLPILPSIFSIDSLESLSLASRFYYSTRPSLIFPSGFTLTCLRSLSLQLYDVEPASLNQLVSELCSLEDLSLENYDIDMDIISLSSRTVKTLKLILYCSGLNNLGLFLSSLESLHLDTYGSFSSLFHIHGQFPLLKRAFIMLDEVRGEDVNAVSKLLNSLGHVEELSLHVEESEYVKYPEPILLEPGKDLLKFPNLKHLDVVLCFHEHNFEAIIMMLHNCPVLESVKLVHKIPMFTGEASDRRRKDWRSKLPRNADGNYLYAYFRNLHLGEDIKEFMKLLGKKCSSKRHAKS